MWGFRYLAIAVHQIVISIKHLYLCGVVEKSTTTTPTKATAETITTATTTAIKAATSTTASTASENEKQEDNQAQKGLSEADSDGAEPTLKRQGTLRRKYNIHRGKQNGNR